MEAASNSKDAKYGGLTLIEMITAVAVIAVVGTLAMPSFVDLRRNAQRTVVVNDFMHAIYFARSEALKRRATISVCRSNDGSTCANKTPTWNGGWIVFENRDNDQPADTDPGEPVLLRRGAITGGTLTSNRVSFSFRPYNQADANGTLVYCPNAAKAEARAIIISHVGRPRASERDASGKPLKC